MTKQPTEPTQLLAVVADESGRRYYRWSYDVHTFEPWQLMGAVHVNDDSLPTYRWSDLPPVTVVSLGVPV